MFQSASFPSAFLGSVRRPDAAPVLRRGLNLAQRLAPGIALCVAVTAAAMLAQGLEARVFGRAWLESLVLAILIGAVLRTTWRPSARFCPGVEFSAKPLLEVAVVLLGASISARMVLAAGPVLLFGIMAVVIGAIALSFAAARLLGLPTRLALLVACGNSICGNSAIAAVAPVIGADGKDVASAVAFTAVLGVAAVLGLPLLGATLHMSVLQYGTLAGLTVYAVPQVLAAAAPMGLQAVQMGTFVKLVRVLMLGPVCLVLSLLARRGLAGEGQGAASAAPKASLTRFVPWFILGFLGLMAARSLGAVPEVALGPIHDTANLLTVVAMAALGLSTDLATVARAGGRVTAAVTLSLAMLGLISFGLIHLLHIA